jgi:hypothetical protein
MLARTPASPLRVLTAAFGACALTGALAGPALGMPTEHGPAPATTSGPAADLVRLHESGTAVHVTGSRGDGADQQSSSLRSSSLGAGPHPQLADRRASDSAMEAAKRAQMSSAAIRYARRATQAAERARNSASIHYAQRTDLRSPDSVDRALAATQRAHNPGGAVVNRQPPRWPVHPASLTPPRTATPAGDGFDWGDAAIGAGGALAILLAALGALLLYRRRGGDLQGDLHGAPTAG